MLGLRSGSWTAGCFGSRLWLGAETLDGQGTRSQHLFPGKVPVLKASHDCHPGRRVSMGEFLSEQWVSEQEVEASSWLPQVVAELELGRPDQD